MLLSKYTRRKLSLKSHLRVLGKNRREKISGTYASSFLLSSEDALSLWMFSLDWHPMARYWATSGWTKLSICVRLDGSISSLCSAPCAPSPPCPQHCAELSVRVALHNAAECACVCVRKKSTCCYSERRKRKIKIRGHNAWLNQICCRGNNDIKTLCRMSRCTKQDYNKCKPYENAHHFHLLLIWREVIMSSRNQVEKSEMSIFVWERWKLDDWHLIVRLYNLVYSSDV